MVPEDREVLAETVVNALDNRDGEAEVGIGPHGLVEDHHVIGAKCVPGVGQRADRDVERRRGARKQAYPPDVVAAPTGGLPLRSRRRLGRPRRRTLRFSARDDALHAHATFSRRHA
jgi:hypothetical protein